MKLKQDPPNRPLSTTRRSPLKTQSRLLLGALIASLSLVACDEDPPRPLGEVAGEITSGEVSAGEVAGEVKGGEVAGEVMGGEVAGEVTSGETVDAGPPEDMDLTDMAWTFDLEVPEEVYIFNQINILVQIYVGPVP